MGELDQSWLDSRYMNLFTMADLVNQPIHIVTPDGLLRFVNQAWCLTYKIAKEDAIGHHVEDLVALNGYYLSIKEDQLLDPLEYSYEHLTKPDNRSAATIALEKKKQVSMLTQTPSNNKVVVTATPILNDDGEILCIFTLIQDLTMLGQWRDYMEDEFRKSQLLQKELSYLRGKQVKSSLVGSSKAMIHMRELIDMVAISDASVLITGESGVGKEVVAKEIHRESLRKDKPFITVNCAAIPDNLLESELFGHEKGSFTGATATKTGLFELANTGTILLDEIGEIPMHLQPKLLRVLQEQELRRVGGTKSIPIDVRVIAATNRDLLEMTHKGDFRMDLYYRLNVFPIHIPSLRERKDDIPLLASSFLDRFNRKYHKDKFFTNQALLTLEDYDWPGNVRELENAVERIIIIGSQPAITADQVCAVMNIGSRPDVGNVKDFTLKEAVENLERTLISDALTTYKSTYKAAEALGSTQSTIARKAKALGIKDW